MWQAGEELAVGDRHPGGTAMRGAVFQNTIVGFDESNRGWDALGAGQTAEWVRLDDSLLVVGSSQHSRADTAGKRDRGDIARRTVPSGDRPADFHKYPSEMAIRRIAVAYDGGEQSQIAMLATGSLAAGLTAKLHVLRVVGMVAASGGGWSGVAYYRSGLPVSRRVLEGIPSHELLIASTD